MASKSRVFLFRIVILHGDGIGKEVGKWFVLSIFTIILGPEVVGQATRVLEVVSEASSDVKLILEPRDFGGCAIDKYGDPLPEETLKACQEADAILMGSIGGPKWGPDAKVRPEPGLLRLRKSLGLYANVRPASFASDSLLSYSPLKPDVARGVDMIVVRELIGGLYFGPRKEQGDGDSAYDTMVYSVAEVQRITRVAAQIAMTANPPLPIHSIDKANVLASSRLWRKVVTETLEKEYPAITFSHQLVDSAAMFIVANPRKLNGVVLTENMFGDILSDESSIIPGSLGLLPSASLAGAPASPSSPSFKPTPGLYEPIHGSAPDIAGKGIANPVGTILSAAMLLRYSLGLEKEAQAVEAAVRKVLDDKDIGGYGTRTADLGGTATTVELGDKVVEVLKMLLHIGRAEG
ncbi:Isopropylmalate dehydrogenase-like domain-containing protein [Scleroderma yunnanense]